MVPDGTLKKLEPMYQSADKEQEGTIPLTVDAMPTFGVQICKFSLSTTNNFDGQSQSKVTYYIL